MTEGEKWMNALERHLKKIPKGKELLIVSIYEGMCDFHLTKTGAFDEAIDRNGGDSISVDPGEISEIFFPGKKVSCSSEIN